MQGKARLLNCGVGKRIYIIVLWGTVRDLRSLRFKFGKNLELTFLSTALTPFNLATMPYNRFVAPVPITQVREYGEKSA